MSSSKRIWWWCWWWSCTAAVGVALRTNERRTLTTTTTTTPRYYGPWSVDAVASEGGSVVFDCPLGFPQNIRISYVLKWSKDGTQVYLRDNDKERILDAAYEGRLFSIREGDEYGHGSINLTDVRATDEGQYECRVYFPNRSPPMRNSGRVYNLKIEATETNEDESEGAATTGDSGTEQASEGQSTEDVVLGPPKDLTIHATSDGYLLSWSPPDVGVDKVRVYVVRQFQGSSMFLVSSKETKQTFFHIPRLDDDEIHNFQVSALSYDDVDVPGEMRSILIPSYGKIRIAVTGVGCVLLVVLVGAILWYAKTKRDQQRQQDQKHEEPLEKTVVS